MEDEIKPLLTKENTNLHTTPLVEAARRNETLFEQDINTSLVPEGTVYSRGLLNSCQESQNNDLELSKSHEKLTGNSRKLPQYIAALSATGGALAAGTVFGWSSPAEYPLVNNMEYGFPLSDEEWSWIGSSLTLGAAIMCLCIGTIINWIGRKLTMLFLIVPFTIGWGLVIWSTGFEMLLIGRIFLGLAGGAFFVAAPVYIGEISEPDVRGKLGSFFQLMVTTGILFVYSIGYGLNVFTFSIICGALPLLFGVIFVLMPESPQYFVRNNRMDDAAKSLKWLRGKDYNYSAELTEMQQQLNAERSNAERSWRLVISRRSTRKALLISLGMMFFLQMSGINAVIFYSGFIFNAANTGIDGALSTIIIGVMQVLATFVASMVVDRIGRRILLLISISVMAVCKIALGVYFYMYNADGESVKQLGWLPIVSLCLYIIVFSLGFGPIPWLMVGELFAPDVKGIASSMAGSFSWIFGFLVTKTFANVREAIGLGETFWLLAGFSVLGTIFVYFIVPETKGKTLVEIQHMLEN